jgi:hypothetical protein
MKAEMKGLFVGLAVAVMTGMALLVGKARLDDLNTVHAGNPQFERQMATLPVPKVWYESSRAVIVSEGEEVTRHTLWGRDSTYLLGTDQRAYVTGQFVASEPERVIFVVMDSANKQRMEQGYPPLVLYASRTSPVWFPMPAGEFWCGFVALPGKQEQVAASLPASVPDLLLWIMAQAAKSNVPPVRVSLELQRVIESYGERPAP